MYQPFLHLYSFSYRAFLILSEQFSFSVFSVCGVSHRCARPPAIGNAVLPAVPKPHDCQGAAHLLTFLPAPIQMENHSFDSLSLLHLISVSGSPDRLPPHISSYHHKAGNDDGPLRNVLFQCGDKLFYGIPFIQMDCVFESISCKGFNLKIRVATFS